MAAKLPKKFQKPLTEKFFRKKVLNRVHLDRDRTFVEEAFRRDSEGRYHLREELSAEERKRLAGILKEIKKNRGFLKFGRLLIVLIIIAGMILFNVLFKDRLLEREGERFLEHAFRAKSDIQALRLRLLDGTISIEGLTIADREAPMENLIDLGATELSIRTLELLKGNFVVRRLSAEEIAFGTPRESSGALESSAVRERETNVGGELEERARGATEETLAALGIAELAVDPEELVDQLAGSLRSREVVREITAEAEALRESWDARLEDTADRIEAVREEVEALGEIDPGAIDSVPTALETYEEVSAVAERSEALYASVAENRRSLEEAVAAGRADAGRLESAIEDDVERLKERIPATGIDAADFATGTLRIFLESFLGSTYHRGMAIAQRMRALQARIPAGDGGPRRGGWDVPFPSVRYPRVYLEEAVATGNEGGGGLAVRLEHLSSDPDLIGEPTAIFYTQERGRFGAELNASVDLRSGSENLGEYTLSLTGVDAALPAGARSFGFRELSGESELSTAGLLSREGALLGRLDLTAREVRLTPVADAGRTATIISEVLSSTGEVAAQISYRVEEGRLVAFSGTTSLAGAFRDRAEALAAELAAQAESRLRSELDALLEDELGEYAEATAALESLSRRSLEELREAETYREIARQQREELETRLAALREEAEDRARAEVEGQVEEARDRVEEEARRRLELPSFGD
jgi:uncharacterized protein (TIGR03545 family)